MTVKGIMTGICYKMLAEGGREKTELSNAEARDIQKLIEHEIGIMIDDRDIKIFYQTFAAQYWKTHTKPPQRRRLQLA